MFRFSISNTAIILFSALIFFDSQGLILPILLAATAHELGHFLLILLFRLKISSIEISASGFEIEYAGFSKARQDALIALAGPLFGFIYAIIIAGIGYQSSSEFLLCSAGISAVFSLFNLLPVPMLDGGKVLAPLLSPRQLKFCGILCGASLIFIGILAIFKGAGIALVLAGGFVLIDTCK
ncbi:M50 family metallopeptidase [Clostridiaceae bacterium OttesenSCG-928-D20]|nr:M50 family metallopeptidase [Clostridiaceae bacterium OttesenSCG-928-D20]